MSFITSPGIIVPPLTAGGVAYGTGSQAKVNSAGTVGQVLTSNGAGVPTFQTSGGVTSFSGASTGLTPATPTTGAVALAGTLAVGSGGTGLATLTANNVILGNGASTPTFVAPGTSGNVLQSNGTTWTSATPAAGGGTVTLTSSGAITAGLGVIVNSNGTGSIPVLTTAITAQTQSTVASNVSANRRATMIYCASVGVYIAFYNRVTDNYVCAKIGTVTGTGVFTWGAETVLNSVSSVRIQAIWVESESKFYISYDDATNGFVRCGTVTATAITVGAQLTMFANASTPTTIAFDPTAGILVYGSGTAGSGFFNFATINTSGITLTANSTVVTAFTSNGYNLFYWPLAQKVIFFGSVSSQLKAAIITITGVVPTMGTNQTVSTSDLSPSDAAFSSNTSNLFLLVNNFSPSALNAAMISISGATITAGTFYAISTSNPTSQASVTYAPNIGAFVISYGSSTPYNLKSLIANVSGTVITYGSATTLISSASNAYPYGNVYDTKYGFTSSFTVISSGTDTFYAIAQTNGSGTLTSDNFLGIAKTSVSTGNSFDVSVSGSTNTAVSGLTAGTLYYLNGNGQLITSPDVPIGANNKTPIKVGLALSATSVVLK